MAPTTDGIVLLAKQSGITSFSSLWQIKNALKTKKIGHTGTLDTFAEGLLVALVGRYTKLVPYFSDCDKEYLGEIRFGSETDTLDPDGMSIHEAPLPRYKAILDNLDSFRGTILQRPPEFSALHINGRRASDLMRKGESVDMPPRSVTIHSLDIVSASTEGGMRATNDDTVSTMVVRVVCSKGTYIRSLARDIARKSGSVAHLSALRRTRTGPFLLENAAGNSVLEAFPSSKRAVYGQGVKPPEASQAEIMNAVCTFNPDIALVVGLDSFSLDPLHIEDFQHGRKLDKSWFNAIHQRNSLSEGKAAVFCGSDFMGVVNGISRAPQYEFVAEQGL